MVIPELIWGRCTYMIFIKFSMGISFEKMQKKLGVTMLVKDRVAEPNVSCRHN